MAGISTPSKLIICAQLVICFKNRFRLVESIDPETKLSVINVGLKVITEKDIALREDIAEWRDALASCFQTDAAPIEVWLVVP